jgi:CHASE3 domain sensor protein
MQKLENNMDTLQHVQQITAKVKQRMKQLETLQKQQEQQAEIIRSLKSRNEALEEQVRLLTEQQQILMAAAGKMSPADKAAFESTINKYIREIDKCIGMLSE